MNDLTNFEQHYLELNKLSSEEKELIKKTLQHYQKEEEEYMSNELILSDDSGNELKTLEAKMKYLDDYNYLGELENAIYSFARIHLIREICRDLDQAKVDGKVVYDGR